MASGLGAGAVITDLMLAELCRDTYLPDVCVELHHSHGAVHFTTRQWFGKTVIGIQGTHDWRQIETDLKMWPKWSRRGYWVHSGMISAAEILCCYIDLHQIELPPPYVLTGHSLGAGVATALAGELREWVKPRDITVVGFGSPRVGILRGLKRALAPMDVRLYRFGDDPVPGQPWCFPVPYRHVRKLIEVGHDLGDPLDAHHVDGYVAAMRRMQKSLHTSVESLTAVT